MKKYYWLFVVFFLLAAILIIYSYKSKTSPPPAHSEAYLNEQLAKLEPNQPTTLYDNQILQERNLQNFPGAIIPVKTILKNGANVVFANVYLNLAWERPVYTADFHSSRSRWSYVPLNLAFQRHQMFEFQGGASWWYDLEHFLALPNQAGKPSPLHKSAFTVDFPYITRLIIFDAQIKTIKYFKSQILVLVEPSRTGIHVVDFNHKKIPKGRVLLQMVTPEGYELDYLVTSI